MKNSKALRNALLTTYDIQVWFKKFRKDLNKHDLTDDEKCLIYLKVAKGLFIEGKKLCKDAMYLDNFLSDLKDINNG